MMSYQPQLAGSYAILLYLGPSVVYYMETSFAKLIGRVGNRFVVYANVETDLLGDDHPLKRRGGERDFDGAVLAKPMVIVEGKRFTLEFILEQPYDGFFKPLCIPPLGGSRWWVYNMHAIMEFYDKEHKIYVLEDTRIRVYDGEDGVVTPQWPMSYCKAALGVRFGLIRREEVPCCRENPRLWPSPVGKPMSIPGLGSLEGEFSVVRRRFGYLKVGGWLAWHRVLGVLDDGRWVVVGDDGLYEAVFTPTVKNPLEEFGEVGYVRVVKPYEGDPDLVQSPCGAPRLVACGEEGVEVGRAVLRRVRRVLDGAEVRGELFVGEFRCVESFIFPELVEVGVPARVLHDWPLADPCPHVLKAADGEPFGLFTPATQLPFIA